MKRLHRDGAASVYGTVGADEEIDVPILCKNTNAWVRNHRAVGTLANEEAGVVPYPELEAGGKDIEEIEEEVDEQPNFLKQGTILRQKTVKAKGDGMHDYLGV